MRYDKLALENAFQSTEHYLNTFPDYVSSLNCNGKTFTPWLLERDRR